MILVQNIFESSNDKEKLRDIEGSVYRPNRPASYVKQAWKSTALEGLVYRTNRPDNLQLMLTLWMKQNLYLH